jgi:hypothetical protein
MHWCVPRTTESAGQNEGALRHSYTTQLLIKGVPITYVSARLGHAKPTPTLQWDSHWLPSANSNRYADGLDAAPKILGTKVGFGGNRGAQVPEEESGPPETRTREPLIKSAWKGSTCAK